MNISNDLKEFLKDNKYLIDENNFEELYHRCNWKYNEELTNIFYSVGIDPLTYMEDIPEKMF